MDFERLKKLRLQLDKTELDSILVSQIDNVHYLSGFKGSTGYLIIATNKAIIAVDFRYVDQAKIEAPDYDLFQIKGDITRWLPQILLDNNIKNIGFEENNITYSAFQHLQNAVKNEDGIKFIPTSNLVESIKVIKDEAELTNIKRAASITDASLAYAATILKPGITEIEIAWELEKYLREHGSEQLPFEIIVASGPNSAWPHARPTQRVISENEPITIDIGAKIDGYCCDISRTFHTGKYDQQYKNIYDIVLSAQLTAIANIVSGMNGKQADALARIVINETGYEDAFGHGLGHGIGLAVHESPGLGPNSNDELKDGMVFTIEPGIYISGWGGVRIEDSVVLEKGKIIVLSKAKK